MQKQLLITFVVLIALVAAAYFGLKVDNVSSNNNEQVNKPLLSDRFDLATINSFSILNAEQTLLHTNNADNVWVAEHLDERETYPIDKSLLSAFVQKLVSANLIEAKSALPANHARLHLLDVENAESNATLVKLGFPNGNVEIILGKTASLQTGQYVRYKGDNQMWLLDKQFTPPADKYTWLQSGIFSIEADELLSIKRVDDGSAWAIKRTGSSELLRSENKSSENKSAESQNVEPNSGGFVLEGFDNSVDELRYANVVSDYVDNILNVDFNSVRVYSANSWQQKENKVRIELLDKQQQTHTVELVQSDDVSLMHVTTFGEQAYVQYWTYEISDYQAREIAKVFSDFLVEPIEKDADAE